MAAVSQGHLDRLSAVGVRPDTIARIGQSYPAFGVLSGEMETGGRFLLGEGGAHVVQPIVEHHELIDLVAWRPGSPMRWGLVNGLGWLLNADSCFASRWDGDRLRLHATPLDWLRADAVGGVVLDWDSPDLTWLRGFAQIDCGNDMVAASLGRALNKSTRAPRLRTMEARHVA
ncbi:hypothetical protein [Sphingomonas sp. BK580]|uniref:hypothetical protein n=1 Tax=Sphingomonas sp. BK580 TaxID=2586972 RepID=UPI0016083F43|nr:hypothetical protein [Sphingomonas sp. BK580]MBB3692472.1 hypothetical protein [Sphingomonas sp. BK580]